MRFSVIGAGVVGTALAVRLAEVGYECVGVHTRSLKSYERFRTFLPIEHLALEEMVPKSELLFITTQDDIISSVAEELVRRNLFVPGQYWIHCSGSLSSQVLRIKNDLPVRCLSLHPLQAFADVENALSVLEGTHFGIEGEDDERGARIVRDLGGIPHRLDSASKKLYHAGAVVSSNYLVTLASLAVEIFAQAGIAKEETLVSLLPLMKGTLRNLEQIGLPGALTGPIARGDVEVVKGHLQNMPEDLTEIYKALGSQTLALAKNKKELRGESYPAGAWAEFMRLFGH